MPKAIHLLVNQMLPEHLHSNERTYGKKELNELIREVSESDPERYASFVNSLKELGRKSVYLQGATLTLDDFETPSGKQELLDQMDRELTALDLIKDKKKRNESKMLVYTKYVDKLTDLAMQSGKSKNSNLAGIIASGARANPSQYRAMVATPGLYTDYKDQPIDMFVRRSFAEGVRPIDFLASTFGTRKSVIATKSCWMKGTLVRMADLSVKPIEQIKVGDKVLGSDVEGNTYPVEVLNTYNQGLQEVVEYELGLNNTTKTTTVLRCTEDHKILQYTPKASRKTHSKIYKDTTKTSPQGSLPNNKEVLPAKNLSKRYFKAVAPMSFNEPDNPVSEPYAAFLGEMAGATTVADGAEVSHRDKLRQEGIDHKYAWQKELPKNINRWDNASVAKYLSCYFACDGSVSKSQRVIVILASPSKKLLLGIQDILRARFSILTQPLEERDGVGSDASNGKRKLFELKISSEEGLRTFWESIGIHVPGYKHDKLQELIFTQLNSFKQHKPDAHNVLSKRSLGLQPCYDIEVDSDSHLFVLANGVIGSNSTADAGDLGKLLVQNGLPIIVNRRKSLSPSGILLNPVEDDLRGRVLAREVAGHPAGTVISRKVEADILNKHKGKVMVHSPLSDIGADGISGEAFGVSYDGTVPGPGFAAGVTAGNALSEPIAQSGLNVKHSGGAYTGGKKVFSGFDYLSQFVQVPDSFKDRAAVSELAGRVESIEDAEQGGKYVTVNGQRHYVLPDMKVTVNPGDEVEPGDILSEGLANPKDIVRLRGLGEGRRYYSRRLKQLLDDSGQDAQLRNTEVIARGALDAVQITDNGYDRYLPDSVVSYNTLEADWKPRDGHENRLTRQSEGRYLEVPLLHYTIGTKLTPRMLSEIEEAGYEKIKTHKDPPPFEPIQIRLRTQSYEVNPDWLARTGSSYLQKNLAESAQRGYDTNIKENPHPFPRLAVGQDFGARIKETGKF